MGSSSHELWGRPHDDACAAAAAAAGRGREEAAAAAGSGGGGGEGQRGSGGGSAPLVLALVAGVCVRGTLVGGGGRRACVALKRALPLPKLLARLLRARRQLRVLRLAAHRLARVREGRQYIALVALTGAVERRAAPAAPPVPMARRPPAPPPARRAPRLLAAAASSAAVPPAHRMAVVAVPVGLWAAVMLAARRLSACAAAVPALVAARAHRRCARAALAPVRVRVLRFVRAPVHLAAAAVASPRHRGRRVALREALALAAAAAFLKHQLLVVPRLLVERHPRRRLLAVRIGRSATVLVLKQARPAGELLLVLGVLLFRHQNRHPRARRTPLAEGARRAPP